MTNQFMKFWANPHTGYGRRGRAWPVCRLQPWPIGWWVCGCGWVCQGWERNRPTRGQMMYVSLTYSPATAAQFISATTPASRATSVGKSRPCWRGKTDLPTHNFFNREKCNRTQTVFFVPQQFCLTVALLIYILFTIFFGLCVLPFIYFPHLA